MTKRVEPTRHLLSGRTPKVARYTPAVATDIRRTFRKARLLAYLRRHTPQASQSPA